MGVGDRLNRRDVLKSGAVLVAGIALERSLRGETRGEFAEPKDEVWAVGNDLIRREVGFRPGVGLYTKQLLNRATKTDLLVPGRDIAKAQPEFSFNCDGKACNSNGGDFELVGVSDASTSNGKSLSVRMKHKNLPLEVTAFYMIYTGHGACRKFLVLKNTGAAPLRITHLMVETLELGLGPENEMTLWVQ